MNERVKEARKALGLTQQSFGARIGVTDGAISLIEKGERNLTEQMLLSICREFEINIVWMKTGEGEMFTFTDETLLMQLAQKYSLDPLSQKFLKTYLSLPDAHKKIFSEFSLKFAAEVSENEINVI
jgi:transcriptional regulator with XRE-family HTH domain